MRLRTEGIVMKPAQRLFIGAAALACSMGILASPRAAGLRKVHVHAPVGQIVRVWGSVNFGKTCGEALETTIDVTLPPAHGSVSIRAEMVKQNSPDFSGRCKGERGMGKVVYYTRTSPGLDHFKYVSSSRVGAVDHLVTVD